MDGSKHSYPVQTLTFIVMIIYRLMHTASELSGYTSTSSLTMNEKFFNTSECGIETFEFIVSE